MSRHAAKLRLMALATLLVACVLTLFGATTARADAPTQIEVTRIAFKKAEDSYLPKSETDSDPYDLVAALKDDEVSTTSPAYKSAQAIEVTVEANGIDASASKVEVVDKDGKAIATASFAQKQEGGSPIDYTYVATVSHLDADATKPLPEAELGIKVSFKDGEGAQLETTNEAHQLSGTDKAYQLFGASVKEFDVGGTQVKKVYADGSLVFDRTAPTLASMVVSRDEEGWTAADDWTIANSAQGRGGTATISLAATEAQMDATKSSVVLVDRDTEGQPEAPVTLSWDEATKKLCFELPDGHWDIRYRLVDAAGNVGSEGTYTKVTVDGTPPVVVYTFKDQVVDDPGNPTSHVYTEGGTMVVTVTDKSFDKTKVFVHVYATNADPEFDYPYNTEGKQTPWQKVSDDTYRFEYDFSYEGAYLVVTYGEDVLGNTLSSPFRFTIDNAPPEVSTVFLDAAGNDISPLASIDSPLSAEVFDRAVTVRVTVTDSSIDSNGSKIVLYGNNAGSEVSLGEFGWTEEPKMGVYCRRVSDGPNAEGVRTIVVDLAYRSDGVKHTPVVKAKDYLHDVVTSRPSDKPFMLVDTVAPSLVARVSKDPAGASDMGSDAAGNAIPNGKELGSGEDTNRVWFFKTGGEAVVSATLTESYGVRSIALVDASGRYSSVDVQSIVAAGNAHLTGVGSTTSYEAIVLANPLAEGTDLPDCVQLTVTDLAGHTATWNLADNGVATPTQGTIRGTLLVEDHTAPTITVSQGIESKAQADAAGENAAYVRYFNVDKTFEATIADLTLRYLRSFGSGTEGDQYHDVNGTYQGLDPQRPVVTIVKDGDTASPELITVSELTWSDTNDNYDLRRTFDTDGEYQVSISAKDAVGNEATEDGTTNPDLETFVIDKTAPTIAVTYDKNDVHNGSYYATPRTATITVVEHNFDKDLFDVQWTFTDHAQGATEPSMSWSGSGDTHTCTVSFPSDGTYSLSVSGVDKANNAAVLASDPSAMGYDSGTFTIDTEKPVIAKYYDNGAAPAAGFDADDPVVEFPPPSGTYSGTNYYAHPISLQAKVQDRTIDASDLANALKLWVTRNGTEGLRGGLSWGRVPDERGTNGYELWQTTVELQDDGEYLTPHVTAVDLADNTADNAGDLKKFVIDVNPPEVKVAISHSPASQGVSGNSGDPVNFYNHYTTLSCTVSDEHLLRSVEIVDPDSNYTVSKSTANAEGKPSVVVKVQLKDGTAAHDAEYQRDIVLTAIDLAGNERTWTIDHNGNIVKDERVDGAWKQVASAAANFAVDGEHPIALVQDTVPPVVGLSGAEAGKYYNKPQNVVATVKELNLDWLKQFDPSRVIVTVTKREGKASGTTSTWTIPASSFTGSKPNYSFTQAFSSDGHYSLVASFRDYATNLSNRVAIGEFTIDMTAPSIKVDFDNNDVRNGKYYKAPRTATITVTEHNFDPKLFKIETTGRIGSWSSSGDTHVCTVYYGEGGPYTLKVSGKDLAGNEASEVTVGEFIVDLTAPEVEISGTAQRLGVVSDANGTLAGAYHDTLEDKSAYNGVVLPLITYKDNEVLSADDLSFALTGSKHGKDTVYETETSPAGKEMTISFADLGYTGEGAADGSNWRHFYVSDYASDADDIYTLSAKLTDQAGNEAEAELTFSVNRFGSNYDVRLQGLSDEEADEYEGSGILWESPTIVVREINVSGVGPTGNQRVEKEFANVTSTIKRAAGDGLGYALTTIEGEDQAYGWSEYVYTIRSTNFGKGSDSDHDDGGQGVYRVNVTSDDASSNANTTAEYWASDARRTEVTAAGATVQFVLDELGPTIEDLDVPTKLSPGATYEASFHVSDDITSGNVVEVYVDGRQLGASQVQGPANGAGTFTFPIASRPFNWARSVRVVVRDYAGREAEATNGIWFWQSTFVPEGGLVVMALAVVGILAYAIVRRRAAAEPELPMP